MMKYISKYLFHSLLQANQCAMVHVPFDDETFLNISSRFFLLLSSSLSLNVLSIEISYEKVYTRASSAWWTVGGYKRINVYVCIGIYIQNQTPERNTNVVVLSYRFNRDKEIERISKEILSFSHLFEHYGPFFLSLCLSSIKPHHWIDYWRNRHFFINQWIKIANR